MSFLLLVFLSIAAVLLSFSFYQAKLPVVLNSFHSLNSAMMFLQVGPVFIFVSCMSTRTPTGCTVHTLPLVLCRWSIAFGRFICECNFYLFTKKRSQSVEVNSVIVGLSSGSILSVLVESETSVRSGKYLWRGHNRLLGERWKGK